MLLNIGFGNVVNTDKVLCIISPESAPAKRLVQVSKSEGNAVDATMGRRTKSVIVADNGVIVLSALAPDTLTGRYNNGNIAEVIGDEDEK